tara:strand:- start:2156 stop:2356 length:201 start_codon:yes stop_codon:yes gene_type:complete
MISLNRLTDIYNRWGDKENLQPLGSADEVLMFNENLTDKQRTWLKKFIEVWEYAQEKDYKKWESEQ